MASRLTLNVFGRLCTFIVGRSARCGREQVTSAATVVKVVVVVEVEHGMRRAGAHVI